MQFFIFAIMRRFSMPEVRRSNDWPDSDRRSGPTKHSNLFDYARVKPSVSLNNRHRKGRPCECCRKERRQANKSNHFNQPLKRN